MADISNENGSVVPHLSLALKNRFPLPLMRDGLPVEPQVTDNFVVHVRKVSANQPPFRILQARVHLREQKKLLETLRRNQNLPLISHDSRLHQSLEIANSDEDGIPFYIVESMLGEPLLDVLKSQRLDLKIIYPLLRELLKAIEPFHEAGMVMGSMDPDQIRISRSQTSQHLYLGGLYRAHVPGDPGKLEFNPEFNAPPGKEDEPEWTAADDVYVVGMFAYRMFLGEEAYHQQFASFLDGPPEGVASGWEARHRTGRIGEPPTVYNKEMTEYLEEWLKKAMAKRADRFADAQTAVEALDRAWQEHVTAVGNGVFGRKGEAAPVVVETKRRFETKYVAAAAGVLIAGLGLLGAYFYYQTPPGDVLAAIDKHADQIEAVIISGRQDAQKLPADGPIVEGFKALVEHYNNARDDYPPTRSNAQTMLAEFAAVHGEADKAAAALKAVIAAAREAQEGYGAARKDPRIAALQKLSDTHALRAQFAALEPRANEALAAIEGLDWPTATSLYAALTEDADAIANAYDKLRGEVLTGLNGYRNRIAALGEAVGEKRPELQASRDALAALKKRFDEGELDTIEPQRDELEAQLVALEKTLPGVFRRLEDGRAKLDEAHKQYAVLAEHLSKNHPLREVWADIEEGHEALEARWPSLSADDARKALLTLQGKFSEIEQGIAQLKSASESEIEALAAKVAEAHAALPENDAARKAADTALAGARKAMEQGRLEEAATAARKARGALEERLKTLSGAIQSASQTIGDILSKVDALAEERGAWVLTLPALEKVRSVGETASARLKARPVGDMSEVLNALKSAADAWVKAADAVLARVNGLAEKAERSAGEAARNGGEDTAAFQEGKKRADAAADALAAKAVPEAEPLLQQAIEAFGRIESEQAENAEAVAKLRAGLAGGLEEARALLAADHPLPGDVDAALALEAGMPQDGTLSRVTAFKTLAARLATAISEAREMKADVLARIAALPERIVAIKQAGGHTSAHFDGVEEELVDAQALAEVRNWQGAADRLASIEAALAAVDSDIENGLILACPNSTAANGTRLVPAGNYSIGGNTQAGRIASDAKADMAMARSDSITIQTAAPFCISMQQVTTADFDRFVTETGADNGLRNMLSDTSSSKPQGMDDAAFVSQTDAQAYADWLSRETGIAYALPTLEQTLAAVAFASAPDEPIPEIGYGIANTNREWTREACGSDGRFVVVGQTGMGDLKLNAQCLNPDERNAQLGFRLVIVQR